MDQLLCVVGVVHVGSEVLHPVSFNVFKPFVLCNLSVESVQRQDVDLEQDAMLFHFLDFRAVRSEVRIAFGVCQNDGIVQLLEF